jgi:hypothetical protein
MEKNRIDAQNQLLVTLQEALAKGKVTVRVTDNRDPGQPIMDAQVEVMDGSTTVPGVTDANGEVTLEIDLSTLPLFTSKTVTVLASKNGFTQSEKPVMVIAVATTDVNLVLVPQ